MATLSSVTAGSVEIGNLITSTKNLVNKSRTSGDKNPDDAAQLKSNIAALESYKGSVPFLNARIQESIDAANATVVKIQKNNVQKPPNVAPTKVVNGAVIETDKPVVINSGDESPSGAPQQPPIALSQVKDTSVDKANDNLAHVCDFVTDIQKNIQFKKYAKAAAKYIRDAIRAVLRALGLADPTGETSWLATTLKAIAREVNRINKEILQPILDFEKYVIAYITKLREIITWILSLPAKFLALLQDCLARLIKLIGSVFTDIGAGLSEGFSEGPSDYDDIIREAKDLATAASNTVKLAVAAAAGAVNIAGAATIGLLIPTNQAELDAANEIIKSYETPEKPPSQNTSTP